MTDQLQRDPEDGETGDEPMTDVDELRERSPRVGGDTESTPRPSPAEGGGSGSVDRPPRPSQAEGERQPE